jgi:uncharacterized membrane protein
MLGYQNLIPHVFRHSEREVGKKVDDVSSIYYSIDACPLAKWRGE